MKSRVAVFFLFALLGLIALTQAAPSTDQSTDAEHVPETLDIEQPEEAHDETIRAKRSMEKIEVDPYEKEIIEKYRDRNDASVFKKLYRPKPNLYYPTVYPPQYPTSYPFHPYYQSYPSYLYYQSYPSYPWYNQGFYFNYRYHH